MDRLAYAHLKLTEEAHGRVLSLELDHGKANEMGVAQLQELERLVADLEQDTRIVGLLTWSKRVTSKGSPIFVAGANVGERVGWPDDRVISHVRWQRAVLTALRRAPVFHVAVVHGAALGWGTEFLLTADWRIATETATFGLPETGLGILPGAGGTSDLAMHVGVPHALRLGMTGERLPAAEALRIGLVQEVHTDLERGLVRAREMLALVARRSPTAVAAYKRALLDGIGLEPEERQHLEALAYEHCVHTGEAAAGRAQFEAILRGADPVYGPRTPLT